MVPDLISSDFVQNLIAVKNECRESLHAKKGGEEKQLKHDVADVDQFDENVIAKQRITILHLRKEKGWKRC